MPSLPSARQLVAAAGALAGACVAYGVVIERNAFALRRVQVPVLPAGADPLTILHISDPHLTPGQRRKQDWIRDLARLTPDLVVCTGDNIAHQDAVGPLLDCYAPLLDVPGVFVLGSNDYYEPRPKNPLRYFRRSRRHVLGRQLPWGDLVKGLRAGGWLDLDNARGSLEVAGRTLDLRGVDDPHLDRDDLNAVAGAFDSEAGLRIGVTHSPEPRVLDAFVRDGADLVLAGHTHGGQVRIPLWGALVTNCGLDTARARGLSAWGRAGRWAWLHVSAGLGTSPWAPYRFACRPEASLLTLVAG